MLTASTIAVLFFHWLVYDRIAAAEEVALAPRSGCCYYQLSSPVGAQILSREVLLQIRCP